MHRTVAIAFFFFLACVVTPVALSGCGSDKPTSPAVLVLGFDGLDPDLVARWEAEGLLPNFARLRSAGVHGAVRSTIPMISPPAWTSAVTGVPPDDHGIWSFWIPTEDNPRGGYVDATRRLAPAIWEDLTAAGRTVGVINVPITCPPDSVNGFMIAGFPYPQQAPLTYPAALEEQIVADGWQRDAFLGPPTPGTEEAWLDAKRSAADARRRIALSLLFDGAPDLGYVVFTTPDRIQHHLWRFHDPQHPLHDAQASDRLRNAVRDIYIWCDDVLGEVMQRIDAKTSLIVLADHGFGAAAIGISRDALVASLPPAAQELVIGSQNNFGGDFYLRDGSPAARAQFLQGLRNAVDPAGRKMVRAVHEPTRGTDRGMAAPFGPDVVAEEAEGYLFVPGPGDGPMALRLNERVFSGWHRRVGFFGMVGPTVDATLERDLDLVEIPALVLALLGEPIPRRYTMAPPAELLGGHAVTYAGEAEEGLRAPAASESLLDAAVAEQLRAIGYLK